MVPRITNGSLCVELQLLQGMLLHDLIIITVAAYYDNFYKSHAPFFWGADAWIDRCLRTTNTYVESNRDHLAELYGWVRPAV